MMIHLNYIKSTITGRGVSNMINYWFGNSGYAKLFEELDYES